MPFSVGDIVRFRAAVAGHLKYHICIKEILGTHAAVFLFLNSSSSWRGDLVLPLDAIPCLPDASTIQSVVGFSQLVRANARQLGIFQAVVIGQLAPNVARSLETHAQTVQTLTSGDKKLVLAGLAQIV